MKKNTQKHFAEIAGVSPATLSRFLNRSPLVATETRQKIEAVLHRGELPLPTPRNRWNVALILPYHAYFKEYTTWCLHFASMEISRRNWHMELVQEDKLESLSDRHIHGAIAVSWEHQLSRVWPELQSCPLVRFASKSSHINNIYTVTPDGEVAAEQAFDYLWSFGHRKIGVLSYTTLESERNMPSRRFLGYLNAALRHGIARPLDNCVFNANNRERDVIVKQVAQRMRAGVTAFLNMGTGEASWVYDVVSRAGGSIPETVSVICGESNDADYLFPRPTVIAPDYPRMAREAMDLLEQRMLRRNDLMDVRVQQLFIKRGSVAAPRISKEKSSEKIIQAIAQDPKITIARLAALLQIRTSAVQGHLARLKAAGRLRRRGPDKGGSWEVVTMDAESR